MASYPHNDKTSDVLGRPQPLLLGLPMQLSLGLVLVIGLSKYLSDKPSRNYLGYLDPQRVVQNRSTDTEHQFPQLGIRVELLDGWVYLSTGSDQLAVSPTFSHAKTNTILRLQPFHFEQWPPEGAQPQQVANGDLETLWVTVGRLLIGRIILEDVDLAVVVVNHGSKQGVSGEVLDFCQRIRPTGGFASGQ